MSKSPYRKLTRSEKTDIKMDTVIWNHGRLKSKYTICIKELKAIEPDAPIIKEAIAYLEKRKAELQKKELF